MRSPFGSMSSAGTPARSTSSISTTPSPVLPEPVMPTITPWVVKSSLPIRTSAPVRACVAGSTSAAEEQVSHRPEGSDRTSVSRYDAVHRTC